MKEKTETEITETWDFWNWDCEHTYKTGMWLWNKLQSMQRLLKGSTSEMRFVAFLATDLAYSPRELHHTSEMPSIHIWNANYFNGFAMIMLLLFLLKAQHYRRSLRLHWKLELSLNVEMADYKGLNSNIIQCHWTFFHRW